MMVEIKQLMLQKYSEEVDKFKSLYQQPKELESRLDAIFEHEFEVANYADTIDLVEADWLENIYTNCEKSGVVFNKRLLKSFHTALKTADWSPLTVLAGVSGTGKSLLPEYYCRFGGIYFKSMAVQPDWDSPQSLFGFFNSIDNRFNATTLIRAMVQFVNFRSLQESVKKILSEARSEEEVIAYLQKLAVEEYNLNDAMFMVLLDEMNLAHVELYFSDMLSKLERRRNSDESVSVEIDMGAGMSKFPLELTNNILWVGTMNEDETTKSLSDKVLDRGNLISFPRPTEFQSRKKITYLPAAPMLKRSVWNEWIDKNVIEDSRFSQMVEKYRESLQRVNGFLGHAGRALGHRVWQSIENYMANHPDVISAFKAENVDEAACEEKMRRAFEEALVHKVMPKLRGIETDGNLNESCIEPIRQELFGKNGLAKGLEKDFNNAVNNPYETFLWCSAEYLNDEE
jgi:5-methylcytosine-specific restriction endonuclease McrBC GTP-binding regulatory subunit McrB